jgi:predicted ribosome quality control (RQC) complex YloA/Tae2 family protein
VEWFFHQAKRVERGGEVAKERLAKLEAEAKALQQQLAVQTQESELQFVEPKEASARGSGLGAQSQPIEAKPFREYRVHGGYRVRVGKGPKHNDTLTLKLSKPDDLWLHARGAGGAHVLLSLARGEEVPQEALLDAAHLALHHSNLKGEPSGEVSYTRARHVRKPKGAAPGAVLVSKDKTFWVRVEPARLTRLIAAEV